MLPNGLEPPLLASEASALSIKLRGQLLAKVTELKSVYNKGDNFKSIEHSDKKFKGIAEKLHCPAEKLRCPAKYLQKLSLTSISNSGETSNYIGTAK